MPNEFDLIEMLRRANVFGSGGIQMPDDPYKYRTPPYFPEQDMGGFRRSVDWDRNTQTPGVGDSSFGDVNFGGNNPWGDIVSSQYDENPMEYTPDDKYSRMFADLIAQQPNREDFKRSKWAKIAALIGGSLTGDFNSVNEVMHGRYNRANADWKQKADIVGRAAMDERARNSQERMYAQSKQSYDLRERELMRRQDADRQRADMDRKKLELATWRAKNQNWRLIPVRGGNVWAINPQNPTQKVDTGVATGSMSELDRINLNMENDIEMEGIRQGNRLDLEDVRQENREDLEDKRQTGRERLVPLRGAVQSALQGQREENFRNRPARAGASTSPSGVARDLTNKANRLISQNPGWENYITVDGLNVRVKPPKTGYFGSGPDPATHAKIMQELYGQSAAPSTTQPTPGNVSATAPTTPPRVGRTARPVPKGYVRITDGTKFGWIDKSELAEAIKGGWKEVK